MKNNLTQSGSEKDGIHEHELLWSSGGQLFDNWIKTSPQLLQYNKRIKLHKCSYFCIVLFLSPAHSLTSSCWK